MKRVLIVPLFVVLALGYLLASGDPSETAAPPSEHTDSTATSAAVYTEAQAERGLAAYTASCADCHGASLQGSASAPPLVGLPFMFYWGGRSIGDLYEYTATEMPLTRPGSLTEQQFIDIVALILQANDAPAGEIELPLDSDILQSLLIEKED